MRQYLELGSTPIDEVCKQVGTDDYYDIRQECLVYKNQLERMFPGNNFKVKTFHHDFGDYCEVVIIYDDDDDRQEVLVYEIENKLPLAWDKDSIDTLKVLKSWK